MWSLQPLIAMASMKMPPRQKMINMMYLVLTAMLAMNVSKEVLDAFAALDADLVRSEIAHEQRSALEYAAFDEAAVKFPQKFGAQRDRARMVKGSADSLVLFIEEIKLKVLADAENKEPSELRAQDATGRDTLLNLWSVERKDDRETMTRLLVGSEPSTPEQGPGSAHELKQRIAAFREQLKALAGSREPALAASLDLLFDVGPRRDASGVLNNWESMNFYDVPLVAGIAAMSKLQADIRSAENDIVKWLYREVESSDYKFNALTAAVIPRSPVVMLGDTFRADVFLAAYDDMNPPRMEVQVAGSERSVIPVGSDGKGKLGIRADKVGQQSANGVIRYTGPKGEQEIPYEVAYQVMQPLLVASPTKMNVLYRGVENPVDLSVPGVPRDRVRAVIDNGTIARSGDAWVVTGLRGPYAQVFAVVEQEDGTTRRIGPVAFRVKDLPAPTAFVGRKSFQDNGIKKAELTAQQNLIVRLDGSDFEAQFRATEFELTFQRGSSAPVQLRAHGPAFTEAMKDVFRNVRPGDKLYIENIKAKLASGEGRVYDLAPLALKIQP